MVQKARKILKGRAQVPSALAWGMALAVLLAGCGANPAKSLPAPTPITATAEEAPPASGAAPTYTVGNLYALNTCGGYWGINTGDAYYELAGCGYQGSGGLILKSDYATLTQSPICQKPGCTHDTAECPAYLPVSYRTNLAVAGGKVYILYSSYTWDSRENEAAAAANALVEDNPATPAPTPQPAEAEQQFQDALNQLDASPSFVDVIDESGTQRERLATFEKGQDVTFGYSDGAALYGISTTIDENGISTNTGIRLALDTGEITNFPLLQDEQIIGVYGNRFFMSRQIFDQDPALLEGDALTAAYQNSRVEYYFYDIITNERQKVLESKFGGIEDSVTPAKLVDDTLYYIRTAYKSNGQYVENQAIEALDIATGETKTVLEKLPYTDMWVPSTVSAGYIPQGSGTTDPWLWMQHTPSNTMDSEDYLINLQSGSCYRIIQKVRYENYSVNSIFMGIANDGRWLVTMGGVTDRHNERPSRGLISQEDFLSGSGTPEPIADYPTTYITD